MLRTRITETPHCILSTRVTLALSKDTFISSLLFLFWFNIPALHYVRRPCIHAHPMTSGFVYANTFADGLGRDSGRKRTPMTLTQVFLIWQFRSQLKDVGEGFDMIAGGYMGKYAHCSLSAPLIWRFNDPRTCWAWLFVALFHSVVPNHCERCAQQKVVGQGE